MSPMERLLAEEWPDGTFGGPRPADPAPAPTPCHDEAAAQHYADLAAAVYRRRRPAA
ncbi:hypothetical protein ACFWG6_31065 [Streptomyces erythrochromogenes]|uniref:hypothetical protein n=1 Tax=Streptomyces erythrochromogenes TaxID=285574 RepID=UPI0036386A94